MKILVTGGAGMIGSNLVRRLGDMGHEVYVADNLWRGKLEYLLDAHGKYYVNLKTRFHDVDLRDHQACLSVAKGMDVVYHLADIVAGINYVFSNQLFLWRANMLINSNMLDACIANKVDKYVYVGTACSFPKSKQSHLNPPPFKEEDVYPAEPESAYGWSKLMGEYEAELAQEAGAISTSILRLHNVYGPPSELDPEKSQVIPALCRKAILFPDEEFVVWGSGNQCRAFLYVDDVIDALVATLNRGMGAGAIQIGPSTSTSIKNIAEKIVTISKKEINIKYDLTRPEGDMDRTADWSKAKEVLGWQPKVDIDTGLFKTYEWCARWLRHQIRS